jgi:hypothetical protein
MDAERMGAGVHLIVSTVIKTIIFRPLALTLTPPPARIARRMVIDLWHAQPKKALISGSRGMACLGKLFTTSMCLKMRNISCQKLFLGC